jgi:acyl-coenzyme A synthetase/AMP-(fatty) acid ligase
MTAMPVPSEFPEPLLADLPAEAPLAFTASGSISAGDFAADVLQLAERIETMVPACRHVLNICSDRYKFIVGFTAALLTDRISLLPSSQTAETVHQMLDFAPDLFCLEDGGESTIRIPPELPSLDLSGLGSSDSEANGNVERRATLPAIPADRIAAYVFTSGSTGTPVPHRKTWGKLVRNATAAIEQLQLATAPTTRTAIVATVPPQHMYGFESSVLLNLLGHCPIWSGRPFYPADIVAALAAVPRPRMLVTTPFHLRTLLDSGVAIPPVDRILSATAPLPASLAEQAEAMLGAPVQEIYGCTETGQIATRQITQSPLWSLMRDIQLRADDAGTIASGGHIEEEIHLGDIIEQHPQGRFQLLGRNTDLINIAGKRTTLGYLNQQLLAIDGIEDGCFYMPDDSKTDQSAHITRLCAIVVAPTLSRSTLLAALRQRIDAIFLPRPLIFVAQLPRNSTGKLPRTALTAIVEEHAAQLAPHAIEPDTPPGLAPNATPRQS